MDLLLPVASAGPSEKRPGSKAERPGSKAEGHLAALQAPLGSLVHSAASAEAAASGSQPRSQEVFRLLRLGSLAHLALELARPPLLAPALGSQLPQAGHLGSQLPQAGHLGSQLRLALARLAPRPHPLAALLQQVTGPEHMILAQLG